MNKILKLYALIALIVGSVYWYIFQTPNLFIPLFGIALLLKSIKSIIEKDKGGFYINLACSIIFIIFGLGMMLN